jgi:hypothetical protein
VERLVRRVNKGHSQFHKLAKALQQNLACLSDICCVAGHGIKYPWELRQQAAPWKAYNQDEV